MAKTIRVLFAGGVLAGLTVGCAMETRQDSQRVRDRRWLAQLADDSPCRATFVITPADDRDMCTLAQAAVREIAAGHGEEFGIQKGDTANVTRVEVAERNYGEPDGLIWIASVTVKGNALGLSVVFERTKQQVSVNHGEDWGLPRVPPVR